MKTSSCCKISDDDIKTKMRSSKVRGSGTGDTYPPTWKWFQSVNFLKDSISPIKTRPTPGVPQELVTLDDNENVEPSFVNEPLPGGGGACSQDPLTFLDFIPCSPLLKPLVPKNDFSSCSLDPQNYCAVPLIPRNFYPCSPYLFTCLTFLLIVKEIAFEPPLSSPCNPFMLKFIDCHFCQLN